MTGAMTMVMTQRSQTSRRFVGWAAALALALTGLVAGCGGGNEPPPSTVCAAGTTMGCTCAGGAAGAQICSADGSGYGACVCGAMDGGAPFCGDGMCGSGESCSSCASDRGACPATCGNGTCDSGEDCSSCASDCGSCPATGCSVRVDAASVVTDSCAPTEICDCTPNASCTALSASCDMCASPGVCVTALPHRYLLIPFAVHLPSTNAGASWDFGGGAPDPFVVLSVDGTPRAQTSAASDTFDATFSDGSAGVDLLAGSTVTFDVWDEDATSDDFAFSCGGTLTPDVLRARGFSCNDSAGGEGNVAVLVTLP